MTRVALCIGVEHDPWLVALAVVICAAGAFAIVQMFERARNTSGIHWAGWAFLTAVASGATIWCTHFVAMLAFKAGVPVKLDAVLTIASLVVAITGTFVGISLAAWGSRTFYGTIGGVVFGAAISGMHYIGMAAYRVDGIVTWDAGYVAASVVLASLLAGAAFTVLRPRDFKRRRSASGTALIVAAIASLHFTAMTAMDIAPLALSRTPMDPSDLRALAIATALVGVLVIGAGIFAVLLDRQARSDAMRELTHMALNDMLTGLPNRAGFSRELEARLKSARGRDIRYGLCMIDVDRFKEVNDVHGHQVGDEVLALYAGRLRELLGSQDLIGRLGGDEFAILRSFAHRAELVAFVKRLGAALHMPLQVRNFEVRLDASIGIAAFPFDARDSESLANNATLALQRAKSAAVRAPCYYEPQLEEAIRTRRELTSDLKRAIERDELRVHYQMQTRAATGEVTGFEALLRWTHPERGTIPPSIFVPIAEQNGLILSLGEWVLRRACADAARWTHDAKVAVNVSPLQLAQVDLPSLFHQVLLETGLPPRRLEVELTETAIMADRERSLHILRQIKALGVGIALDDFGTGYSSLETLRTFPFDKIKLDRFFATDLKGSPESTAILRAVLALGKSLSIPVLAEGVETPEQLEILVREGCDQVQGFLLGYPTTFTDDQAIGPRAVQSGSASG